MHQNRLEPMSITCMICGSEMICNVPPCTPSSVLFMEQRNAETMRPLRQVGARSVCTQASTERLDLCAVYLRSSQRWTSTRRCASVRQGLQGVARILEAALRFICAYSANHC